MAFNSLKATAEFFGDVALQDHIFLWPLWLELLFLLVGCIFITK